MLQEGHLTGTSSGRNKTQRAGDRPRRTDGRGNQAGGARARSAGSDQKGPAADRRRRGGGRRPVDHRRVRGRRDLPHTALAGCRRLRAGDDAPWPGPPRLPQPRPDRPAALLRRSRVPPLSRGSPRGPPRSARARRERRDGGPGRHRPRPRTPGGRNIPGSSNSGARWSRCPIRMATASWTARPGTAPSSPGWSCGRLPGRGCARSGCWTATESGTRRDCCESWPGSGRDSPGAQPLLRRAHLRRPSLPAGGGGAGGAARHGRGGLRGQHGLRPPLLAGGVDQSDRRRGAGRGGGGQGAVLRARPRGSTRAREASG